MQTNTWDINERLFFLMSKEIKVSIPKVWMQVVPLSKAENIPPNSEASTDWRLWHTSFLRGFVAICATVHRSE